MTLSRRTPLRATQFVRRLPLSPSRVSEDAPKRYPGPAAISARLRESRKALAENRGIVLERDQWRCVLCGSASSVEVHHRVSRGAGGSSRNPAIHSPANMVTLCRVHHGFVESHRTWAGDMGLLVRRGRSPELFPVHCKDGWTLFAADGTKRIVTIEGETP